MKSNILFPLSFQTSFSPRILSLFWLNQTLRRQNCSQFSPESKGSVRTHYSRHYSSCLGHLTLSRNTKMQFKKLHFLLKPTENSKPKDLILQPFTTRNSHWHCITTLISYICRGPSPANTFMPQSWKISTPDLAPAQPVFSWTPEKACLKRKMLCLVLI